MTPRQTRMAAVLGVALFLSYAYFYGAGGWNQNSRFALIRAILERHTLQIDAYQLHTGDRALWRGHYYTDKAPGASLLALAPVQAARLVSRAAGVDPASFPGIAWTSYVAAVVTSGVFTVIAALCVFWLSLRWGASDGAALFAATAYGIASPAWAYATLFMGHGQTAGCLMIALVAADALGRADAPARGGAPAWIIGLAGGWAVVTEFQAAIPAVFIGLLAIDARAHGRRRSSREGFSRATRADGRRRARRGDRRRAAARLQHARVRIAVSPGLLERGRLQGAADRLLRHHLSEALDDPRAARRQLSRAAAAVAADGRGAARPGAARAQGAPRPRRSSPPASASTTCCSTRRISTGKAAGRSGRDR